MERNKIDQLADLSLAVFRLNGVLTDWGDNFSASENLSSATWKILGALSINTQPLTAPQIADRMGITRQGVQKQLNLLVQKNLIEAHPNSMHKRSPLYALTESGRNAYNVIDERSKNFSSQIATSCSAEDLETTITVLTKLIDIHASME